MIRQLQRLLPGGCFQHEDVLEKSKPIADEEAFRSRSLRVLYLDGFRNIIREGRVILWMMISSM
jgi:hypothetical protein